MTQPSLTQSKPTGAKGVFVKNLANSTTMDPGVRIDPMNATATT